MGSCALLRRASVRVTVINPPFFVLIRIVWLSQDSRKRNFLQNLAPPPWEGKVDGSWMVAPFIDHLLRLRSYVVDFYGFDSFMMRERESLCRVENYKKIKESGQSHMLWVLTTTWKSPPLTIHLWFTLLQETTFGVSFSNKIYHYKKMLAIYHHLNWKIQWVCSPDFNFTLY